MAVYVTGYRDQPNRAARLATSIGSGIEDVTRTLFTLQQLQDKKAEEAAALNQKSMSLAVPLAQLQAKQEHWKQLEAQHQADRQADALKEQERRAEEGKSKMDALSKEYELKTNLLHAKRDLFPPKEAAGKEPPIPVGQPGAKRGPNAADESRLLAQDEALIKAGKPPTYLTGMEPDQALRFIKDRRKKLNAVNPLYGFQFGGDQGAVVPGAPAAPVPDVNATTSGTKYKVVSP